MISSISVQLEKHSPVTETNVRGILREWTGVPWKHPPFSRFISLVMMVAGHVATSVESDLRTIPLQWERES